MSAISLGNDNLQNYDAFTLNLFEEEDIQNVNQIKTPLHFNLDDDLNSILFDVFSSSEKAFNFL